MTFDSKGGLASEIRKYTAHHHVRQLREGTPSIDPEKGWFGTLDAYPPTHQHIDLYPFGGLSIVSWIRIRSSVWFPCVLCNADHLPLVVATCIIDISSVNAVVRGS